MKIKLKPNERRTVSFVLSPRELAFVDLAGEIRQDAGTLKVLLAVYVHQPHSGLPKEY